MGHYPEKGFSNERLEDVGVDYVHEILMPRGNAGRLVGDATAYFFPMAEAVNFVQTWLGGGCAFWSC